MQTARNTYSRRPKESHAETVLYEIDLLRFARDRLLSPQQWWTDRDEWVYLEDFLLHYRNLIDFFGMPEPKVRGDDLSILHPEAIWSVPVPEKAVLDSMTKPDLWEKYSSGRNDEAISKYLHHCTTKRLEAKAWEIETMYEELRPVLEDFERLLPAYLPTDALTKTYGVIDDGLCGNSTTSTRILGSGWNPTK
jgi:hypothetical protein